MNKKGLVFSTQRFSVDDGSGIRTCIFLKGCPLSCKWCHNIESQNFKPEIAYYPSKCIGCGTCKSICPNECHTLENGRHFFDRSNCNACGKCVELCYPMALDNIGEEKSVEDIMKIVKRDIPFYGNNGGITVTGGEPMAQFEFLYDLAVSSKKENISFMIETSGYGKSEDFEKIVPLCDCFLYDCKASSDLHKKLTGVDDKLILHNLDVIYHKNANIILRCPIVPGANLNEGFLCKLEQLAAQYPRIKAIQLLPYHKTGLPKAERLGLIPQDEYEPPARAVLEETKERLKPFKVQIL